MVFDSERQNLTSSGVLEEVFEYPGFFFGGEGVGGYSEAVVEVVLGELPESHRVMGGAGSGAHERLPSPY